MKIVKNFKLFLSALAVLAVSACSSVTNLSPEKVAKNSSNTYTLTMTTFINDGYVVEDSVRGYIVIDGKTLPMKSVSSRSDNRMFEVEYAMPKNQNVSKYYYVVKYKTDSKQGGDIERTITSGEIYTLTPESRYVTNMSAERGHVGTQVTLLGRGFNSQDKVKFGNVYADVIDNSKRDTLTFVVPSLPAGKSYEVSVVGEAGQTWSGTFKIDTAEIASSYDSLELVGGETVQVIFDIGFMAPETGLQIDVRTNIPASIIMPEIMIAPGKSSIAVPIRGAAAGKGNLYLNARGFREKVIPVTVGAPDVASRASMLKVQDKVNEIN